MNGKKLTEEHVRQLVMKGRTGLIKGFKKKDGSATYDARLALSPEFKVRLEFEHPPNTHRPYPKMKGI